MEPINEWNTSKSGRIRIRLHELPQHLRAKGNFEVYALDGHELLPRTKSFKTEAEARAYANTLWASL